MRRWQRAVLITVLILAVLAVGVWLIAKQSGLVQPSHWEKPPDSIPVISTRGSFQKGQLAAGHDADDYAVEGSLPGYSPGSTPPADLLIVIHGFNNTAEKALYKFGIAQESLATGGYKGVVAGYSWDADTQWDPLAMTGYHEGMRNARGNGPKLAQFIVDYKARCPQTRVHLLGYSMGARLALEALLALQQNQPGAHSGALVASVHLVGAAVENEEVELDQRYGQAIATQCQKLFNYYSPEDNKLTYYYPLKEADRALGLTDIEHPAKKPANYVGVNASRELPKIADTGAIDEDEYGDNHSGYLGTRDKDGKLIDNGAMDLVAHNIAAFSQEH
jgi:pimeloyl-ACP methyl ester carboxylesterase